MVVSLVLSRGSTKKMRQSVLASWKIVMHKILCGHLELNGYQVMRGVDYTGGLDPVHVKKFDRVFTGHFHQKHEKENVHYFGTAYQMTFNDLFEKKGFHIYDTETDEIEFVENPDRRFHSIQYTDDADYTMVDFRQVSVAPMSKCLFTKRRTQQDLINLSNDSMIVVPSL